jgi:hypothetical protein
MLKCTPYIKNICQNINVTLFAGEGAEGTNSGGSNPNSPRHRAAEQQPRQTEVRLTDLKSVKVDLIKAKTWRIENQLLNQYLEKAVLFCVASEPYHAWFQL